MAASQLFAAISCALGTEPHGQLLVVVLSRLWKQAVINSFNCYLQNTTTELTMSQKMSL